MLMLTAQMKQKDTKWDPQQKHHSKLICPLHHSLHFVPEKAEKAALEPTTRHNLQFLSCKLTQVTGLITIQRK